MYTSQSTLVFTFKSYVLSWKSAGKVSFFDNGLHLRQIMDRPQTQIDLYTYPPDDYKTINQITLTVCGLLWNADRSILWALL